MTTVTTTATYKTKITADLPDWPSSDVTFQLVAYFFTGSGEEILAGEIYTMTLDATGNDDDAFYLPTPDNTGATAVNWRLTLPSGYEKTVTVGYSATAQSVHDLIAAGATTTDPDTIVAALASKATKASGATAGNLASLTSGGDLADSGYAASDFDAAGSAAARTGYAVMGQININDEAGVDYPAKFTAAITRLQAVTNGEGGMVVFPPGRYDLSAAGLIIPRKMNLKYLVIMAYGAEFYTSANNITLIKRTYPANSTEASDGMTSERIVVMGGTFTGNSGTGQVGIDVAMSSRAAYIDCEFQNLEIGAIQTGCVMGLISRCNATLCTSDGFIQRSGYGEGTPLWTSATTANSAGNHSVIQQSRVYAYAGARSSFRILANNATRVLDCVSEGNAPQYGIYYDNQAHTSGKLFSVDNLHSENTPTAAVIKIDTDGHAIIDRLQQRASGACVLIDAAGSNTTSGMIVVKNLTDVGASQTFTAGGRTWVFEQFGAAGSLDPSDAAYWTGGTLPTFLNWMGNTISTTHGINGALLLGSKSAIIYGDGTFIDGTATPKIYTSDATPSVAGYKQITISGTSYSVTNFDDGYNGQIIYVYKVSETVTVVHGAGTIVMQSGGDWTTGHPVKVFYRINSRWYEV